MNNSIYRFTLDTQSYVSQVSLPVRQFDVARTLYIDLTDGGVPYEIEDGCRAVFFARKPDGTTVANDCIIEKNTTIMYKLGEQTTTCEGVVYCEIRLYGINNELITSPQFIIVVDERVAYDDDYTKSESDWSAIDDILKTETARVAAEVERVKAEAKRIEAEEERKKVQERFSNATAEIERKLATGDYNGLTPYIGNNGNWWIGKEDTGVQAEGQNGFDVPLRIGQSNNSIIQRTEAGRVTNQTMGEGAIALGEGNFSGCKGYYFTEIYYGSETLNPQIKIDSVQPTNRGLYISPEALSKNPTFEAPNYAVGDVFSLICNDHFVLFGTITKIDHDIMTFEGDIELFKSGLARMVSQGNAKMVEEYYVNLFPQYDDYTLCVPDKPLNGIVEVCRNAFASGYGNISAGEEGTALGAGTKVVGAYGHTSGKGTLAGYAANAEGSETQAPAKYSHAQNKGTKALGLASTAMGNATLAEGEAAVAEGNYTKALGPYSHSEGWLAEATGSATHAEGRQTIASGARAHAEGWSTIASAADSHAEGRETKATAGRAHSEGYLTEASGLESHAGGRGTKATATAQTAIGKYNKENPDALFIVGNGTSDTFRSNAFEVLKDGKIALGEASYGAGDLQVGTSALPTGALYFVYE